MKLTKDKIDLLVNGTREERVEVLNFSGAIWKFAGGEGSLTEGNRFRDICFQVVLPHSARYPCLPTGPAAIIRQLIKGV